MPAVWKYKDHLEVLLSSSSVWQETRHSSLPLPEGMGSVTSLCPVETRKEECGRGGWIVGVGGTTVVLWYSVKPLSRSPFKHSSPLMYRDVAKETVLRTVALSCSYRGGELTDTKPLYPSIMSAFREQARIASVLIPVLSLGLLHAYITGHTFSTPGKQAVFQGSTPFECGSSRRPSRQELVLAPCSLPWGGVPP